MKRHVPPALFLLIAGLLVLGTLSPVLAESATPIASPVAGATHGIQVADMDLTVDPADDFYQFANGGWLDRTEIPADRASWGVFDELNERTKNVQLEILDEQATSGELEEGSDPWKVVQFFAQGTDTPTRNANGIAPLADEIAAIDAITDAASLQTYLEVHAMDGASGFFVPFVFGDLADSSVNAVYLSGPLLGLPNRDYYLEDDEANEAVRTVYNEANARFLVLLGASEADAAAGAQAVYELEKSQAAITLTREEEQDFSNFYNPIAIAELSATYGGIDWDAYLATLGITGVDTVIVTDLKYLQGLAEIVANADIETIKNLMKLQIMWFAAPYVDETTYDIYFSLNGVALSGQQSPLPVEERVLNHVNGVMGEAVGQLYVAEVFPPAAKDQIVELVDHIIAAYRVRLEANTWMTTETRDIALAKLDHIGLKVGYPDKWRSYDAVEVGETYVDSIFNGTIAESQFQYSKAGKPVDRGEWGLFPQDINAYYDAQNNEIVFPAAILQPPFFDFEADAASNYGAIGYVIGHEITHGFDITGSQFDAAGNLVEWWSEEDRTNFEALQQQLVDQYNAIEVLPGLTLDGQIEVGENTADLGGIQNAYAALQVSLEVNGDPGSIDGFTQDQRFFIAASQVWREKVRDEALTTQVKADEHAPGAVRAVQPLRNADSFYEAFGIEAGSPMFLPPEERIAIW